MDIVKRNFFGLIRSGAFNEYTTIEPMSPYKWRQLAALSIGKGVCHALAIGIRHHQYDKLANIPQDLIPDTNEETHPITEKQHPELANFWLNRKLRKIRNTEIHAIDTSTETLDLLDIILTCITTMLNHDISIRHLIELGVYLRTKGDKVDFVKFENWLHNLHLYRAAGLQGCLLITALGFEADELPFVHTMEPRSSYLLNYTLSRKQSEYEPWHIHDTKPVFIHSNSRALWCRIHRCIMYIRYAPIETISNLILSMAHSIAEVEE